MAPAPIQWLLAVLACAAWWGPGPVAHADAAPDGSDEPPAILSRVDDTADSASWNDLELPEPRPELIRERYPNRKVKLERQVIQDAEDNYVNHGTWKMWDPNGQVIAEGQFVNGQRDGTWVRWFRGGEAKLFAGAPYKQFRAPFVSQATFKDGKLEGTWTIFDGKQRKASQWEYADGMRHGTWTWWFTNGRKMRDVDYLDGDLSGQYREWSGDGQLTTNDSYEDGRKLARKVTHHRGSQKQTEGMYLHAKITPKELDTWWTCELAGFSTQGDDEKHGPWSSWYPNGQIKLTGQYKDDGQVGTFTWWHQNGQKAAEGMYADGKQVDKWTWWHGNGLKSIQGEFRHGAPTSRWTWWQEDGKVAQKADFTNSVGRVVEVPLPKSVPAKQSRTTQRRRPGSRR